MRYLTREELEFVSGGLTNLGSNGASTGGYVHTNGANGATGGGTGSGGTITNNGGDFSNGAILAAIFSLASAL
jgi:hypothetical protein